MTPILYGALVIHAERRVPDIYIPALENIPRKTGQHVLGRYNGGWTECNSVRGTEIYLPQRYKHLSMCVTEESLRDYLVGELEALDARYPDARQLYKLNRMLAPIEKPFASVVNIASAVQESKPVSGSFYLLSRETPLYCALVFDIEENSVQLVWSTIDFKTDLQSRYIFRYVFFALPTIVNRPVFINSQALCARWWKFIKGFGDNRHSLLRAANALELVLYKDPDIESYGDK